MEKNFMDFYLIDDRASIMNYANLGRVNDLNSLEKCLLIDFLIKQEDKVEQKVNEQGHKLSSVDCPTCKNKLVHLRGNAVEFKELAYEKKPQTIMCDGCAKDNVLNAYGCTPCDYDLCPECAT